MSPHVWSSQTSRATGPWSSPSAAAGCSQNVKNEADVGGPGFPVVGDGPHPRARNGKRHHMS
eukprot:351357-Chlamydomonas_euryale.AAC.9